MMPQKKNPDSLELARGKTGRVAGHLVGTLMVLKGLPLSYNRDLQETQESLFDTAETLEVSLAGMVEAVSGLKLRPASERPPLDPSTLSTDIAEELVRRGVPFRTAHERVARWSRTAAETATDLRDVAARQARDLSSFLRRLSPETSVARRDAPGGTAPRRVRAALKRARKQLLSS
jgi:argininosuccinate lyase